MILIQRPILTVGMAANIRQTASIIRMAQAIRTRMNQFMSFRHGSMPNKASHGDGYCIAGLPPFSNRAC